MIYKYNDKFLNKISKENLIVLIKKYDSTFNTTKQYILKHTNFELPNKWVFNGSIKVIYDLLDLPKKSK